jgi:hypothetical protein
VAASVARVAASGFLSGGLATVGTGVTGHIYITTADYFLRKSEKNLPIGHCPVDIFFLPIRLKRWGYFNE